MNSLATLIAGQMFLAQETCREEKKETSFEVLMAEGGIPVITPTIIGLSHSVEWDLTREIPAISRRIGKPILCVTLDYHSHCSVENNSYRPSFTDYQRALALSKIMLECNPQLKGRKAMPKFVSSNLRNYYFAFWFPAEQEVLQNLLNTAEKLIRVISEEIPATTLKKIICEDGREIEASIAFLDAAFHRFKQARKIVEIGSCWKITQTRRKNPIPSLRFIEDLIAPFPFRTEPILLD